ncbi:MAG: hypothetical protein KDD42_02635 [Bdellovibrionales bacterium]|nr:hypothetical protein [Bdellovibrionales bacterium]
MDTENKMTAADVKGFSDIMTAMQGRCGGKEARNTADSILKKVGFSGNDQFAEDVRNAAVLGSVYQTAEDQYLKAVSSGDEAAMRAAEIVFQKAERMMAAFSSVMSKAHELMMQIINRIGR